MPEAALRWWSADSLTDFPVRLENHSKRTGKIMSSAMCSAWNEVQALWLSGAEIDFAAFHQFLMADAVALCLAVDTDAAQVEVFV